VGKRRGEGRGMRRVMGGKRKREKG